MQRQRQNGPLVGEVEGKIQTIVDNTLPFSAPRVLNADYRKCGSFKRIMPQNSQTTFVSGSDTINFDVLGEENSVYDPSESYIEFSLDYKTAAGVFLSDKILTNVDEQKEYCGSVLTKAQFEAVPVVTAGATNYVYINNPMALFQRVQVLDWSSQTSLILNESPGIWTAINKTNQDASFYDDYNDLNFSGVCLCNVHSFEPSPYVTAAANPANYISPSFRIPVYEDKTTHLIFPEVLKQLKMIKNSVKSSFRFRIPLPMISDLFNGQKLSPFFSKLTLKLPLNTYNQAVTDVKATITVPGAVDATHPITTACTSHFNQFLISNCFLVLKKYTLSDSQVQNLSVYYQSGKWEIPFCKYYREFVNVGPSVTYLNHTINRADISDLRQVIITIHRESDLQDNCNVGHNEFVMGNAFTKCTDSTEDATKYDGIKKVEFMFNGRSDIIFSDPETCDNIGPYSNTMLFLKDQLRNIFTYDTDNILCRDFDGLNRDKIFNAMRNASFMMAFDFTKLSYAEKAGLNLSESPLNIAFTFGSHGGEAFRLCIFLVAGCVLQIRPNQTQAIAGAN